MTLMNIIHSFPDVCYGLLHAQMLLGSCSYNKRCSCNKRCKMSTHVTKDVKCLLM